MTGNPWEWRDGHNPYRFTPFQVLDLEVDVTGRADIEARIRRRRRRIERAPERYRLFGRALGPADVNEAAGLLADPETRLLAELRTHRPEHGPGEYVTAEDLPPEPPEPPPEVDPYRLLHLLPDPEPWRFPPLWKDEVD